MYEFVSARNIKLLFYKIDYTLRRGGHIQRQYRGQEELFRFIRDNYESMLNFYKDLFGLSLQSSGEGDQQYFFLDINSDEVTRVPSKLRNPLKAEFVIIGIFLCKLFYVDFSEIETIPDFKKALREEYEPYKADFYRLLAYAKGNKYTSADDNLVDQQVTKAFREFDRLGWIRIDDDHFDVMPSLERLRLLYYDEIYNIDEFVMDDDSRE